MLAWSNRVTSGSTVCTPSSPMVYGSTFGVSEHAPMALRFFLNPRGPALNSETRPKL
jgi:hypothetical protein